MIKVLTGENIRLINKFKIQVHLAQQYAELLISAAKLKLAGSRIGVSRGKTQYPKSRSFELAKPEAMLKNLGESCTSVLFKRTLNSQSPRKRSVCYIRIIVSKGRFAFSRLSGRSRKFYQG